MTLQDVIDLLLDEARSQTPRQVAITRAVLLAYELGKQDGDLAPTSCLTCGRMVPPRVQARLYCSLTCKSRLAMRRMRQRRTATSRRGVQA